MPFQQSFKIIVFVFVREKFVNLLGKEENIETELKLNSSDNKPAAKLGLGW